jgi:hypothetical protein
MRGKERPPHQAHGCRSEDTEAHRMSPVGQSRAWDRRDSPVPNPSLIPAIPDAFDATQESFRDVPLTARALAKKVRRYSITLSERASNEGGMVRPSASHQGLLLLSAESSRR